MDGARSSCYYQDSALIFLQQAEAACLPKLAKRIGAEAGNWGLFDCSRQHLSQKGVVGVARSDAVQVRFGHQQREIVVGRLGLRRRRDPGRAVGKVPPGCESPRPEEFAKPGDTRPPSTQHQ